MVNFFHHMIEGFLSLPLPIFSPNDTLLLSLGTFVSLSEERETPNTCVYTHKYQKYLFKNALRDLFLMQITQAEIILSFRLNYIPYISGASWVGFFFLASSSPRRLL